MVTIVENFGLTAAQRQDATQIIAAISQYVEGKINESFERRHFHQGRQQPGESFDDYLVSLQELAKTCNFCIKECAQKSIRDQNVESFLDGDAIHVSKERELTLNVTILKYRAQEAAKQQCAEITSTSVANSHVQAVQKPPWAPHTNHWACVQGAVLDIIREDIKTARHALLYVVTVAKLVTSREFVAVVDDSTKHPHKEWLCLLPAPWAWIQ